MAQHTQLRRREGTLTLAFWGLVAALSALGFLYYREQVSEFNQAKENELDAIATSQMEQIYAWRRDQITQVALLLDVPMVVRQIETFLAQPEAPRAREEISRWMEHLQRRWHYRQVLLLDTQRVVRLGFPAGPLAEPVSSPELARVFQAGGPLLSDLQRGPGSNRIHLDVVVPVFRHRAPAANPPAEPAIPAPREPLGVLVCQLDPEDFLYPLLARWPAAARSRTAEIELVRQEGKEVLYLNDLRRRPGTALHLRFPMTRNDLPAVQAVLGERLARRERDYEGRPVLAAYRRIPDSPWYLVAKVDLAEIYAPLRGRGLAAAGAVLGLVLLAGLATRVAWQRQKLEFARQELAAERQRQALAERVTLLLKQANDAILLTDDQWRIVDANDRAIERYGYTLAELQRLSLRDLRAAQARLEFDQRVAPLTHMTGSLEETCHRCKDGTTFPVESSARTVQFEGRSYHQFILRDITERRQKEREIRRLNRLYAVLSEVNQAIVRVSSRESILQKVCDIAVQKGGFRLAWIGWLDSKSQVIRPCVQAGRDQGYVERLHRMTESHAGWDSLAALAIQHEQPCIANDFPRDPRTRPWQDLLGDQGFLSAAAFPLRSAQGQLCGALSLYAEEGDYFTEEEVTLLREVGEDVSFALRHLDHEARRRQAETALRRERDFTARILETVGALVITLDREGRVVAFNRACQQITGYSPEEVCGRPFWEFLLTPEEVEPVRAVFAELSAGLFPRQYQNYWVAKSGARRLILWSNTALLDERGRVEYVLGTGIDITEHHEAEMARRASEARLRAIIEQTPSVAVLACDAQGRVELWNNAAAALYGWTDSEALGHTLDQLLLAPEAPADWAQPLAELAQDRRTQWHEEQAVRAKDGRRLTVDSTLFAIPGPAGRKQFIRMDVDLTERKRAEEALRLNEQRAEALLRLNQMTEDSPQALTDFALEQAVRLTGSRLGYLAFMNDDESVLTMHSWSQAAMADCAIRDKPLIYPVEVTGLWGEAVRQRRPVITNDYAAPNSLKKGTPPGHVPIFRHANVPVFDGTKIVAVAGVGNKPEPYDDSDTRQLTILMQGMWRLVQRQRAAGELRAYRDRLDAVLKSIPLPMFAKDRAGRYLLVNEALARFFQVAPERLVGHTVHECYPSEDAAVFQRHDLELMDRDEVQVYEHRLKDGQGRWREVVFTKACFHTPAGEVAGLVGTMSDITERKRTEDALRALVAGTAAVSGTDFFRSLVRHLAEALAVKYAFVAEMATPEAPTARVLHLWSDGQLAGPMDYELAGTPCATVLRESLAYYPEAVQQRFPNGPLLRQLGIEGYLGAALVDTRKTPLGLLVVMDDKPLAPEQFLRPIFTIFASRAGVELERIRAERRILELNRGLEQRVADRTAELTQSNQELEAFSYSVSHDLRAPLRHVSGFVELLREHLGARLDDQAAHFIRVIVHSTQEMARLIDDLLAFSRMGRVEMHRSRVELSALLEDARTVLAEETSGRPIEWNLGPLPTVTGDPTLLRLALVNLLSNAVKYTRGRQPARIEVACQTDSATEVVVSIRDNGAGFDMRFVGKLFGVFQRLHRPSEYEGTGIGLANVRRIIQRHGGRVWAEGIVNQGATFFFSLPKG